MKLERREIEKEKSRRERGKEIVRSKRERESKTYVQRECVREKSEGERGRERENKIESEK